MDRDAGIDAGSQPAKMIPYGRQSISESDIKQVVRVLRSDFLTQGPMVPKFEQAVTAKVGSKHAVAANSATSSLHIACLALGLGPGDWLWTSPNTFVASANCGIYCGARVKFVDIDPFTYNMSLDVLETMLKQAEKVGALPKIVVPVLFAGQPTDQKRIWELAQTYGFRVLEDASHAIGASRNGEPVGSCRWSDITVFSFHPVKIITTGEGGMALTNDEGLAQRMAMLRTHGITRDDELLDQSDSPPWYYEQQMLGFNYRMNDIQASLGVSQLENLNAFIERRNALAKYYGRCLTELPLTLQFVSPENFSAYHLYVVRVKPDAIQKTHRQVFEELRHHGVGVNLHYMPVHLQPFYRKLGFEKGLCPEAEKYADEAITLPLFPGMSHEQQDIVVDALKRILV